MEWRSSNDVLRRRTDEILLFSSSSFRHDVERQRTDDIFPSLLSHHVQIIDVVSIVDSKKVNVRDFPSRRDEKICEQYPRRSSFVPKLIDFRNMFVIDGLSLGRGKQCSCFIQRNKCSRTGSFKLINDPFIFDRCQLWTEMTSGLIEPGLIALVHVIVRFIRFKLKSYEEEVRTETKRSGGLIRWRRINSLGSSTVDG